MRSYVFLLFKQPAEYGAKHSQLAPPERNSFNVRARGAPRWSLACQCLRLSPLRFQVRAFAAANKLQDPAGVTYFEAEKPAARHKEH